MSNLSGVADEIDTTESHIMERETVMRLVINDLENVESALTAATQAAADARAAAQRIAILRQNVTAAEQRDREAGNSEQRA